MNYAGVRPERVHRVVSLEGFGIPGGVARRRAAQDRERGSTRSRTRRDSRRTTSLGAVADRLQKNESAPAARQGGVSRATLGGGDCPTAAPSSRPIRATSCRFRTSTGSRNTLPIWRSVTAPVLWVAAERIGDSALARAPSRRRSRRRRPRRRAQRVSRTFRNARLVTIADAGHMLHHDQPAAVARADRTVPRRLSAPLFARALAACRVRRAGCPDARLGTQLDRDEGGADARASRSSSTCTARGSPSRRCSLVLLARRGRLWPHSWRRGV